MTVHVVSIQNPKPQWASLPSGISVQAMKLIAIILLSAILLPATSWSACNQTWDADKLVSKFSSSDPGTNIRFNDNNSNIIANVRLDQIRVFQTAKDRITNHIGMAPKFIICADHAPNAFAMPTKQGPVVGVTVGMLKLVDGDQDQAAYVIGHEIAHHTQRHGEAGQTRQVFLGILGAVIGVAAEYYGSKHHVPSGIGYDVVQAGVAMTSAKFSRDQEREADEHGLRYMAQTGFNPLGAVRLANLFTSKGAGGIGLFYDSHPGWEERGQRVLAQISQDASLQSATKIAANTPPVQKSNAIVTVVSTAHTTPEQNAYIDAVLAYRNGNYTEALQAFRLSAEKGYAPAINFMGVMNARGLGGLLPNDMEAVKYYRKAADNGDPFGQANLGAMYAQGRGGLKTNEAEAARLYQLAATQGNPLAQSNLGVMYSKGAAGLKKDDVEAARLYKAASDQGYIAAKLNLGAMYEKGRGGLPQSDSEAARLYKSAAEQGNLFGQTNLGLMYEQGRGGLRKDITEAERLYRLASLEGGSIAQERLDEIEKARKLVQGSGEGGSVCSYSNDCKGNLACNRFGLCFNPAIENWEGESLTK